METINKTFTKEDFDVLMGVLKWAYNLNGICTPHKTEAYHLYNKLIEEPSNSEMTVEPSPQWMKDAGKEIQEKYNLDYVDRIYITGIIARHYRLNNSK